MRSSHDDDAGNPLTSLIASFFTLRRRVFAVGMQWLLPNATHLASGGSDVAHYRYALSLDSGHVVRHFTCVQISPCPAKQGLTKHLSRKVMFIIWKRNGLFVPFIVGVVFLGIIYTINKISGDPDYCSYFYWPKMLAGAISAALVWFIGRRINRGIQTEEVRDKNGKIKKVRNSHSLYFVDFEYWAFVILGFTIGCYWV